MPQTKGNKDPQVNPHGNALISTLYFNKCTACYAGTFRYLGR